MRQIAGAVARVVADVLAAGMRRLRLARMGLSRDRLQRQQGFPWIIPDVHDKMHLAKGKGIVPTTGKGGGKIDKSMRSSEFSRNRHRQQ